MAARALEFAAFMTWFIETQELPPISAAPNADGFTGGGIALLGWSAGNLQTFTVLAHADKVPEKTHALFATHFRSLIVYGTYASDGALIGLVI